MLPELSPEPRTEGALPSASPPFLHRLRRIDPGAVARRLLHFWIVWTALLFVHEAGHLVVALREGLSAGSMTVGAGPVLWVARGTEPEIILRLVPVVGVTTLRSPRIASMSTGSLLPALGALAGGTFATLGLAALLAGLTALLERRSRQRCRWARVLIADSVVLTVFNFLPVPPLDGGRVLLVLVDALRGAPLSDDTLFWVQLGGLALAVAPMTIWTRWTARIDAVTLWWRAPRRRG